MCVDVQSLNVRSVDVLDQESAIECRNSGETILFVEDEAFVREVISEVLRSAGYRVLTASSAAEAVSVFDACREDLQLLLTDVILPGETGRVLAAKLRRKKVGLRVLLVTGYTEEVTQVQAQQDECLRKPFSTAVLLRRVRQLLDQPEQDRPGLDQLGA
jgi:two-component system cell cycle sensor histidine kinase/response regulator CckA